MTALSMNCPHCGSTNEFNMLEVHKATSINCSHCGEAIGPWGELIRDVDTADAAGSAPGSSLPIGETLPKAN